MKRKLFVSLLIVCLAAGLFAGCSQAAPVSASSENQPSGTDSGVFASSSAAPSNTPSSSGQPEVQSAAPTVEETASPVETESSAEYKIEVPYDLETEQNTQKSVDEGHSPWRLDAAFVAQVFVSLQISPEGITGDYPIPYEDFKVIQSSDAEAIVEVNNDKSPTVRVYLKRLVKQEDGGIWTVVGYDPAE